MATGAAWLNGRQTHGKKKEKLCLHSPGLLMEGLGLCVSRWTPQTGHGKTSARHTSLDLVAFLEEVVLLCSPRQEIHIILDNLSAHNHNSFETSCNSIRMCSFTSR